MVQFLKAIRETLEETEMTAHQVRMVRQVRMVLPGSRPTNMRKNKDFPEQKNSSRKHLQACFFTKI